jgi:hypothetical protein
MPAQTSRVHVPLLLSFLASPLAAQIDAGSAVVGSKPGVAAPTTLQLATRSGAVSTITGLASATTGTSQYDGARALLATDDGLLFAGLGVDNSAGATPAPLTIRLLLLAGNVAVSDSPLATLMQVPAGQIWTVVDMKERFDGSLLVLCSQVALGPNPMPNSAVFTVDRAGVVQQVPSTGMPIGSPIGIADLGDRYVVAVEQSFFVRNLLLQSLSFTGSTTFRIAQFTGFGSFAGMGPDVSGELVFAGSIGGSTATMHRIAPVQSATAVDVPNGPTGPVRAHVEPGGGILSAIVNNGRSIDLVRADDVLAGTLQWATGLASDPLALAVRANPRAYGLLLPVTSALGSQGNVPALGNALFALRAQDATGSASTAFLFGGVARANIPTPFGPVLVDPAFGISVFGFTSVPANGVGTFPLAIPNAPGVLGFLFDVQAFVVFGNGAAVMTNGLEFTVQ